MAQVKAQHNRLTDNRPTTDYFCRVFAQYCFAFIDNFSVVPYPFDYTAVAVSGKVGAHKTGLTTSVG